MAKSFLVRCDRTQTIRTSKGDIRRMVKCDLTVSQLAGGEFRCFKCPASPTRVDHWLTADPRDMLLHVVDHLTAGAVVPVSELDGLIREAARWA